MSVRRCRLISDCPKCNGTHERPLQLSRRTHSGGGTTVMVPCDCDTPQDTATDDDVPSVNAAPLDDAATASGPVACECGGVRGTIFRMVGGVRQEIPCPCTIDDGLPPVFRHVDAPRPAEVNF